MPILKDEFHAINEDGPSLPDLAPDTTQGTIYRFLLENADRAFRQREIVDAVDVPEGSVGPTLKRLKEHRLVEHRDRFWTIADVERVLDAFVEDLFGILRSIRSFRVRNCIVQPQLVSERREVVWVVFDVELIVEESLNLLFLPWLILAE
jgi:hypothetical protein